MNKKSLSFDLFLVWLMRIIAVFSTVFQLILSLQKSNEYLLALEMFLGLVLVILPDIISKLCKIVFPSMLHLFYLLFVYGSVFLGTGLHFYGIPYWDKGLHLISGALLASLAWSLLGGLVTQKHPNYHISPLFIAIYGWAFAVFCGVIWECYEFTCDSFGMNLQRYMQAGHMLVGRAALMDTMGDLIADLIGGLIMGIICWINIRRNYQWLNLFYFKKFR